ncbi:hypothetical protein ACQKWADRAFT_279778 [Trichoderma austrokoningii]
MRQDLVPIFLLFTPLDLGATKGYDIPVVERERALSFFMFVEAQEMAGWIDFCLDAITVTFFFRQCFFGCWFWEEYFGV